jgi:hypothetical protein
MIFDEVRKDDLSCFAEVTQGAEVGEGADFENTEAKRKRVRLI